MEDEHPSGFADAHLHPLETIPDLKYRDLNDAEILFGCTSGTAEWDAMSKLERPGLVRFYGVHPWNPWVWNADAEEELRSRLDADPHAGVGEIGLDSNRGSLGRQMPAFESQIAIAKEYGRIANIHCSGCEKEVLDVLERCRPERVVIHSFSNESYAVPFVRLGCHLSVNQRVMARAGTRVTRLLSAIPGDRLLLESDAPFTPKFEGMGMFVDALAEAGGLDPDALRTAALDNTRAML